MPEMNVLDLFSGIGGFSLGLERTGGFKTVAFCEIESYPQQILKQHWPDVPIYDDVRELTKERLAADGIRPDVITGGFPCQDISVAGKQKGIEAERSGLWSECARLLGEIRPRYAIFENVTALLSGDRGRWFQRVLWDISKVGYDAEWHCIPASAIGANHIRDRAWILVYPNQGDGRQRSANEQPGQKYIKPGQKMADTDSARLQKRPIITRMAGSQAEGNEGKITSVRGWWDIEPDVGRVANGIPSRVDRIKALGNAVVPQIPELIGRAILEAEAKCR